MSQIQEMRIHSWKQNSEIPFGNPFLIPNNQKTYSIISNSIFPTSLSKYLSHVIKYKSIINNENILYFENNMKNTSLLSVPQAYSTSISFPFGLNFLEKR